MAKTIELLDKKKIRLNYNNGSVYLCVILEPLPRLIRMNEAIFLHSAVENETQDYFQTDAIQQVWELEV